MIVVTGAAGFIGSNLVHALNARGREDLLLVDDLREGRKYANLTGARFADILDKDRFAGLLGRPRGLPPGIEAVFHQGACSTTTEWDGRHMLETNYHYSQRVLDYCARRRVRLVYASSAAVYGKGPRFVEAPEYERPLNVYGWSKLLFDRWVQARLAEVPCAVAGLRYFNVYGPREGHKGTMASVAWHFYHQAKRDGVMRLFGGCDGWGDGEQRRDFIHVDDVVAVNLWLLDHPEVRGVFNVGTGRSHSFNEVAEAVRAALGRGRIEYLPFPDHLKGAYQSHTEADIDALRRAGYDRPFLTVPEGVARYVAWLEREAA
ncbi:MAG: ADP-L-glycero-D-manno-heptose-6-epimerase [Gammaproteobacteria bacterium]|nr:MAG: ADP-L-glycero-D-manno-heptose-6-epimerase [Gammaproteobacteria bacterium]